MALTRSGLKPGPQDPTRRPAQGHLQRLSAPARWARPSEMDQEGPSWAHPTPTAVRVDLPCLGPRPCLCTFPPGRRDTAPPTTWAHIAALFQNGGSRTWTHSAKCLSVSRREMGHGHRGLMYFKLLERVGQCLHDGNKLPTAQPPCVPAVPQPRPAPPRPQLCTLHRPAHHQGLPHPLHPPGR